MAAIDNPCRDWRGVSKRATFRRETIEFNTPMLSAALWFGLLLRLAFLNADFFTKILESSLVGFRRKFMKLPVMGIHCRD